MPPRRANPQGHGIGLMDLLDRQITSRKKAAHTRFDLPQPRRLGVLDRQSRPNARVAAGVQNADRALSRRANHRRKLRVLQRVRLSWSEPLGGQIGQITQPGSQRVFTARQRQQMAKALGADVFPPVDADALHCHGHAVALAGELPPIRLLVVQQRDLTATTTMHLIDHVGYGAESNSRAVEHQACRPFVLADRLMQQHECMHHRRLARSVGSRQQRQRTQRQLQQGEALEVL